MEAYLRQDLIPFLKDWMEDYYDVKKRLTQLERLVQYPNTVKSEVELKSQAAQVEATRNLYAPLRSDTRAVIDLAAFARRLIDMQDLGHAVTEEVRELAKRALGLK
jgi:hypothetical protein